MPIEKNHFKVSTLDSELSKEIMPSKHDDDFDLLELTESGEDFCQVGESSCSIPFELYDLPGLSDILSMNVWNDVLSEDERISLANYFPDMDQESFLRTMKELFTGCNLNFGSPTSRLFDMLKGGLCDPKVALYQRGLRGVRFMQKRQNYHALRKYHNTMITDLYQTRDAWLNCKGYSIDDKLRLLNIIKNQKRLIHEKMEVLESGSSEREESGDGLWSDRMLKDRTEKQDNYLKYRLSPTLNVPSQEMLEDIEPLNVRKQNPKRSLKVSRSKRPASKESGHFPSIYHPLDIKFGLYGSASVPPRPARNQIRVEDEEEEMFEVSVQKDQFYSRIVAMDDTGEFEVGKKHGRLRGDGYDDSFMGRSVDSKNDLRAFGRNRTENQLSDIKILTANHSNTRFPHDYGKKLKHSNDVHQLHLEDQMKYGKGRTSNLSMKRSQTKSSYGAEPFWHSKSQPAYATVDPLSDYDYSNHKRKKGKIVRSSPDRMVNVTLYHAEHRRTKPTLEEIRGISMQNRGRVAAAAEGITMLGKGEQTESDSSEQFDVDGDYSPWLRRKCTYSNLNSGPDPRKFKFVKKYKKGLQAFDRPSQIYGKYGYFDEHSYCREDGCLSSDDDQEELYSFRKSRQLQGFDMISRKAYPVGKRQKRVGRDYSVRTSSYLHEYISDEPESPVRRHHFMRDNVGTGKSAKKGQKIEVYGLDRTERFRSQSLSCSSVSKKRKAKYDSMYMDEQDDLNSSLQQQLDAIISSKRRGKRKWEKDNYFEKGTSEPPATVMLEEADVEVETIPQRTAFTLITPSVHTGFSFSIIHLLSAVRMAMITLLPEDSMDICKPQHSNDGRQNLEEQDKSQEGFNGNSEINNLGDSEKVNVPSLSVQEIVNRVRSNPGDPCILETQEPLQDLVRGVLKIFSSKTAPLGAKGWKTLAVYEKSIKTWSWIGPVPQSSSDQESVEEVTSPDTWGLSHKMLVKLVDSFANWLKSGQETLQQIGRLPSPPLLLMHINLDEKERFKDLKTQKSQNTISPSSEKVREYFRKEEVLRYSIPDRVFSYTAVDGKKSVVAPLRSGGGKPTSKIRDHFMLKRDRPPHVTILCLVRDAAARLPGSIGTRADVCTLIRDSQYIVEDVTDVQVNQVVSGAMDRLHYELDPCVRFDFERKLWVYLHRDREEEDFEDDGTSSTKNWKRQRKEVLAARNESNEQNGLDLSSEVNVEPSGIVDNDELGHVSEQGDAHQGPSLVC